MRIKDLFLKLKNIFIYREVLLSSSRTFILGILIKKKIILPNKEETFFIGIKVKEKQKNITKAFTSTLKGKRFVYFCFHSGEFFYFLLTLKKNFILYKDIIVLSNFSYLKQVFDIFNFDKKWVDEHFMTVSEFYPSLAFFCSESGKIINKIQIDHCKGWKVNGVLQVRDGKYKHISEIIPSLLPGNHKFDYRDCPHFI